MRQNKKPRFIQQDKKVFHITLQESYWYYQYHNWFELSEAEQKRLKDQVYQDINDHLQSDLKVITIFSHYPGDEPLIRVYQVKGRKRPRIVYKRLATPIYSN